MQTFLILVVYVGLESKTTAYSCSFCDAAACVYMLSEKEKRKKRILDSKALCLCGTGTADVQCKETFLLL